ncbi:MAG: TetR family transcriptional regulator, partial [Rhodobacteraceae bacterium]|nr:TetR family transcriptional regulator [Paracoccaceae bacterium]
MPRQKTIPDARILATVSQLLAAEGDKAVSFASVAAATGLAAPTLVQRFGSRDGMVRA